MIPAATNHRRKRTLVPQKGRVRPLNAAAPRPSALSGRCLSACFQLKRARASDARVEIMLLRGVAREDPGPLALSARAGPRLGLPLDNRRFAFETGTTATFVARLSRKAAGVARPPQFSIGGADCLFQKRFGLI